MYVVTVLLEYLTDCSIRVSPSCLFLERALGGGACAPIPLLDPPLNKVHRMQNIAECFGFKSMVTSNVLYCNLFTLDSYS